MIWAEKNKIKSSKNTITIYKASSSALFSSQESNYKMGCYFDLPSSKNN